MALTKIQSSDIVGSGERHRVSYNHELKMFTLTFYDVKATYIENGNSIAKTKNELNINIPYDANIQFKNSEDLRKFCKSEDLTFVTWLYKSMIIDTTEIRSVYNRTLETYEKSARGPTNIETITGTVEVKKSILPNIFLNINQIIASVKKYIAGNQGKFDFNQYINQKTGLVMFGKTEDENVQFTQQKQQTEVKKEEEQKTQQETHQELLGKIKTILQVKFPKIEDYTKEIMKLKLSFLKYNELKQTIEIVKNSLNKEQIAIAQTKNLLTKEEAEKLTQNIEKIEQLQNSLQSMSINTEKQ